MLIMGLNGFKVTIFTARRRASRAIDNCSPGPSWKRRASGRVQLSTSIPSTVDLTRDLIS